MRDLTITLEDVLERNPCWDRDDIRGYAAQLGWERASAADLLTLRGRLDDADLIWLLCDPRLWPRVTWLRVLDGWADRTVRVHLPSALDAAAAEHRDLQHRTALREAAQRCRDEGTRDAAGAAARAAARAARAAWAAEAAEASRAAGARAAAARADAWAAAAWAAARAAARAAETADGAAAWAAAGAAARAGAWAAAGAAAWAADGAGAWADGDERRRQLDDFEQAAKEVRRG